MTHVLMIIGVILAVLMAAGIAQNERNINQIIDNMRESENAAHEVENLRRSMNVWNKNTEQKLSDADAEIEAIVAKLDEYAKDFRRLDEIDAKAQEAMQKASDAARCVVLNNGGVNWAETFVCNDDEQKNQ